MEEISKGNKKETKREEGKKRNKEGDDHHVFFFFLLGFAPVPPAVLCFLFFWLSLAFGRHKSNELYEKR